MNEHLGGMNPRKVRALEAEYGEQFVYAETRGRVNIVEAITPGPAHRHAWIDRRAHTIEWVPEREVVHFTFCDALDTDR